MKNVFLMEEFIRNNPALIKELLVRYCVDKSKLEDLKSICSLEENMSLKNNFPPMKGKAINIKFIEPINSNKEFIKYMKRNNLCNYTLSKKKYMVEDFRIVSKSGIIVDFYNPWE